MSASFASALPYRVPSSQRGGPQFRQRSQHLTPIALSLPDPSSPSVYSQLQGDSVNSSSTATITLVKQSTSVPRQTPSYVSRELDLVKYPGPHTTPIPATSLEEAHPPFSLQDAYYTPQSVDSKGPANSFRGGFLSSGSIPSSPRESIATCVQRVRRIFYKMNESDPSQVLNDISLQRGMNDEIIDAYGPTSADYSGSAPIRTNVSTSSIRLVNLPLEREATIGPSESSMTSTQTLHPNYSEQIILTTPNLHSLVSFATAGATAAIVASPHLLNSIGRTTVNFTRKFPAPWKTSASSDRQGFAPLVDNEGGFSGNEDGKSLYLSARSRQKDDGLGLDGDSLEIGRWTSYKWILTLSVLVVSVISTGLNRTAKGTYP